MEKEFKAIGQRQGDVSTGYLNYQDAYQSAFLTMLEKPDIIDDLMNKYQLDKEKAFNLMVKRTTENKRSKQRTIEKYELLQADTVFINLNDNPQSQSDIFDIADWWQSYEAEKKWTIEHLLSFMKNDEQKQLFIDYYIEGLTLEEIATAKGLTKPAVFYQVKQVQRIIDKSNVKAFYSDAYCQSIGQATGKRLAVEQNYRLSGDLTTIPTKAKGVKVKARNKTLKRLWKAKQESKATERAYLKKIQVNAYYPRQPIGWYYSGYVEHIQSVINPHNKEHASILHCIMQEAKEKQDVINLAWDLYQIETAKQFEQKNMAIKAKVEKVKQAKASNAKASNAKASTSKQVKKDKGKESAVKASTVNHQYGAKVILRKRNK
ncbi:MAG: hypothetical protein WCY59_02755 [Anaerovoracaceae bacterium]